MTRHSSVRARRWIALGFLTAAFALVPVPVAGADFKPVSIVDNEFRSDNITVRVGDTVVWRHEGDRPHGVRSDAGFWDSSPGCSFQSSGTCMKRNDTFSVTFDSPGTFFYFCPVHGMAGGGGMNGHVTVASASGGTTTTTTRPATTTTRPKAATTTSTGRVTTTAPATTASTVAGAAPTTTPTTAQGAAPAPTAVNDAPVALPAPTVVTAPTTTVVANAPVEGESGRTTLIIILLVVVAALLAAGAWYFRPGARL